MANKTLAQMRGRAIKKQTTDLDNVKSFSAEGKDFIGLNKTEKVPFPKPKKLPDVLGTTPGSTPDNGKLRESYTVTQAEILMQKNDKGKKKDEKETESPKKGDEKPVEAPEKKSFGEFKKKRTDEAYDGGAPNVGNNNYAQNLPAPIGSGKLKTNKRLAVPKKEVYSDVKRDTAYAEGVIMSVDDLSSIFEAYLAEDTKVGEGNEPDNIEAKKFRGTNAKGPGTGKVRSVKRKYLGSQKGRTATGSKAHAIDVQPVIGTVDKNWNKTTPSGDRK